jgi:hypothetical protein
MQQPISPNTRLLFSAAIFDENFSYFNERDYTFIKPGLTRTVVLSNLTTIANAHKFTKGREVMQLDALALKYSDYKDSTIVKNLTDKVRTLFYQMTMIIKASLCSPREVDKSCRCHPSSDFEIFSIFASCNFFLYVNPLSSYICDI